MAWTTPRTWVTSEFVTAAELNEQIRDNMVFLKSNPEIGRGTSTSVTAATATTATVLTISGLAIPADVGAVYVEVWASHFGCGPMTGTGYAQVTITDSVAGLLRRGGNTSAVDQRYLLNEVVGYAPLYMRTDDLAWAGSTRTITLEITAVSTTARIAGTADNPIVMRVMRAY